jgi:hypothetical protein
MEVNRKIVSPSVSPFSHLVKVGDLGEETLDFAVPLSEDQGQALCAALGLLGIVDWTATAQLCREPGGQGVSLRVKFALDVIQSCVVTLDPVRSRVEHSFINLYVPEAQIDAARDGSDTEVVLGIGDSELPDALTEAGVDVGEAIAERLALIIDPYPRKEGARFQQDVGQDFVGDGSSVKKHGPFAALGSWRSSN